MYEYVKSVNTELKKFDHVLLDYTWKGTINIGDVPGEDSRYTTASNERISGITDTTGQAVIGCMKDSEGFDGYLIANAGNPDKDNRGAVTTGKITFQDATRALVYVNGECTEVPLTDKTYTWNVAIGTGVFVIPLK